MLCRSGVQGGSEDQGGGCTGKKLICQLMLEKNLKILLVGECRLGTHKFNCPQGAAVIANSSGRLDQGMTTNIN